MSNQAKILSFDIEVTPLKAYSWGPIWEANLLRVIEQSKVLSFSAKWLGGKHITKGWIHYKGYKPGVNDDEKLVAEIWQLFDEADIIVTQNGKAFDIKTMNSRFIAHKLPPPSPYKIVDTKTMAKGAVRLPSYSLDNMCDYFGIGKKEEHEGFPLWEKCMAGDRSAWKRMLKYNAHDVKLTETLYLKLRPFAKTHPNIGIYSEKAVCPKCGSGNVQRRGVSRNISTIYHRLFCKDCGAWGRESVNLRETKLVRAI